MVLRDYRPTVIGWFPSTGIVIDDKGHVVTFVGNRWVDIDARNPRVEIVDGQGQKHSAKLVGIDQSMRVAVVLCQGMALKKTPLCEQRCDMKNGVAVVLPAQDGSKASQLESAQVVSVSTCGDSSVGGGWAIKINRPMSAIGAPILNARNQVIGLIADQPTGCLEGSFVASSYRRTVQEGRGLPHATAYSQAFVAINISSFLPLEEFKQRVDELVAYVKGAPLTDGFSEVRIPGERAWFERARREKSEIPLNDITVEELRSLANPVQDPFFSSLDS